MTELYYPLLSLREGHWFKLICGASFQHLPAVRNLTLAYALAGADCIDVAADPAVIAAARDGLEAADKLGGEAQTRGFGFGHRPLLMVSLNDGEDPHFRKAEFDPEFCPVDCPRPCEKICPAQAIVFQNASNFREEEQGRSFSESRHGALVRTGESPKIRNPQSKIGSPQIHPREPNPKSKILNLKLDDGFSGVIDQRCYGCGRCLPICPSQLIYTRSYVSAPEAIAGLIVQAGVDALEIHTQVGHLEDFQRLWQAIAPWVDQLKLIAISCQDGDGLIDYLWALHKLITPLPCPLVWQTDGRPMSGDIGTGATRAAVKLSQKVLAAGVPGYVQLAGGTNNHTVAKLKAAGLLKDLGREIGEDSSKFPIPNSQWYVAGVAYGSYARILLSSILDELEEFNGEAVDTKLASLQSPLLGHLEEFPTLLWQAVAKAHSLVGQLKSAKKLPQQLPN